MWLDIFWTNLEDVALSDWLCPTKICGIQKIVSVIHVFLR